MPRLHITQDETGFWQLSLEDAKGRLTLLSHQFSDPDHLIQDARELVADGTVADAVILIGPPRPPGTKARKSAPTDYKRPAPRKAVR
jgi:hypothetical protein